MCNCKLQSLTTEEYIKNFQKQLKAKDQINEKTTEIQTDELFVIFVALISTNFL